jgi:hypothetical protein
MFDNEFHQIVVDLFRERQQVSTYVYILSTVPERNRGHGVFETRCQMFFQKQEDVFACVDKIFSESHFVCLPNPSFLGENAIPMI